jgi:hypothetical protein
MCKSRVRRQVALAVRLESLAEQHIMITPCKKCGNVLLVPKISTIGFLPCRCGHRQMIVGMPSLLEPTRVSTGPAFPWLPEFPPRR